jgi:hypothetical protein
VLSIGRHRRGKRGVGSIIGATFVVLILISGFAFYAIALNVTDHYNAMIGAMGDADWRRNQESIVVRTAKITSANKLNLTVENAGPISSRLIWLGIFNRSVTPESQGYFALSESILPAETKSLISSFTIMKGKRYVIQLVTELGNKIESRFYPASQVRAALTLITSPPTAYAGNNVTVLLTITNNDTEVDIIESLTVTLGTNPSGLVSAKEQPVSLLAEGLKKGESVFFRWVYNTVSTGTVTYNASYSQAPSGSYALSKVVILSSPGGGGEGTVAITGVNCTTSYHPMQYRSVGSTQYISGSISDLANNDSSYMAFQSYISGGGVNANDFVDSETSNVDGSANKGTHSNFTAQKYGPDSIYDVLTEGTGSGSSVAYYPSGYSMLGSTQLVSGSLANLQSDDAAYMIFRSYQSASLAQALYVHSETTVIGGTSYYLNRLTSADGTPASLSASMEAVGRQLFGKSVYSLMGISSIPASTWTMYYRTWKDAGQSIAFNAARSGHNGGGASTVSWSHTTGSGSNRIMIVGVSIRVATVTVSSLTYGAQSLTFLRADTHPSSTIRSEIWYLIAPASGTATVTVTLSGTSRAVGGSCTFTGVVQTSPIDVSNGATGSSSSPSGSVTVVTANSILLGHLAISGSSNTVSSEGSGQTATWDNVTSQQAQSDRNIGHGSTKGPVAAGSQSMSWGLSGTTDWAVSIVALKPADAVGHADADILIRRSDGTIRSTIGTGVTNSADMSTTAATLSGTYSWTAYTVVNQTDYLEIDYYVDVTTARVGASAYLRIDDNTLAITDQTRATNVMLPSEYTVEVEFFGTSNMDSWTQLVWTIDSSFTTSGVTATFQLYNYTAAAYSSSGNGYVMDTIGSADVTKTQTITANPTHFRDGSGNWRLKIKGVKVTTSQLDWRGDLVKFEASSTSYALDLEAQWTGADYNQANEWLCIFGGTMNAEDILVDVWSGGAWVNLFADLSSGWNNISVSSYLTAETFTIRFRDGSPTGDASQSSWNIDVSLLHVWTPADEYTAEVEFVGTSNLQAWTSLVWQIDSAWNTGQVTVTVQFYNFTLGDYSVAGDGYVGYVSSVTPNTDEGKTKTVTVTPSHFRNSTGYWRVKIKGVKATGAQFQMKVDWIDFQVVYSSSGDSVPYDNWQWYTIKATSATGNPLPYVYVSIYANGTSIAFRNGVDKRSVANPGWVRMNAVGEYYLELKATYGSVQTFVLYASVGSVVGQKTVTQGAP